MKKAEIPENKTVQSPTNNCEDITNYLLEKRAFNLINMEGVEKIASSNIDYEDITKIIEGAILFEQEYIKVYNQSESNDTPKRDYDSITDTNFINAIKKLPKEYRNNPGEVMKLLIEGPEKTNEKKYSCHSKLFDLDDILPEPRTEETQELPVMNIPQTNTEKVCEETTGNSGEYKPEQNISSGKPIDN